MKTKQVPIIITLIAGLAICIIGFLTRMETKQFVKTWVIVLIIFYILGCVAKLLLDKNFKEEPEEATEEAAGRQFLLVLGALDERSRERTIVGRFLKETYSRIERTNYCRVCAACQNCGRPAEHVSWI